MDIHRRENLTPRRFESIVNAIVSLIKNTEHKVVLVMLNVTKSALRLYHFESKLQNLSQEYPEKFIITPLWKEYAHVIEFLDSGHCWAEMTDSGSMQEELLYFPDVLSLTVRLNTDRPKTVFDAIKKESEDGAANFYPWLHQRINLWREKQLLDCM